MKTRVLLLQEVEVDRQAITRALSQLNYDVIQSRTVTESVDTLRATSSRIAVVLAALHLEHESSFDLLRDMRSDANFNQVPFLFCCLRPSQFTTAMTEVLSVAAKILGAEDLIIQEALNADFIDRRIRCALADISGRGREGQLRRNSLTVGSRDVHND